MEVVVNQKLYVGNLPYSTTDQELQDLFANHGNVQSANVVADHYTGRSRGFGFVEMGSAEEAQQAISALNGIDYGGRNLVVNEARPKEIRPPSGR
jgi:RNA recognition motif-containing protein